MAVIACGMYMSRKSATYMSPRVRLQATAVWDALTFVLNGIVFVLMGLQLPYVMAQITGMRHSVLLRYGIGFSIAMMAVRMAWVYGETYLSYGLRRWVQKIETDPPRPGTIFIIGWGGMRGVLSLAAAISLPFTRFGGSPFPQRNTIIYLAFCLMFATVVVQGLTMPLLIRVLGLSETDSINREEHEARRVMLRDAITHLSRKRSKNREQSAMYSELIAVYQRRLDALPLEQEVKPQSTVDHSVRKGALLSVLQVEREALIRLRDEDQIDDEVLRTIQHELDLSESRVHTGSILEY
jgi:NhaP-type Na+/H+ or K+/H+ antiporter